MRATPLEPTKPMPTFDIETEEITAFDLGDTYIFKTYFDEDPVYNQLQKYYNQDKYRFEVPERELEEVEQLLDEYYYELEVTDDFGSIASSRRRNGFKRYPQKLRNEKTERTARNFCHEG